MNRFLSSIAWIAVIAAATMAGMMVADSQAADTQAVGAQADTIQPFAPDSFRRIVAQEKGRPFVVMLWSLDCAYCQPSFAALAAARKTHGVDVITIATDPADDAETARLIARELSASGLTGDAWAFGPWPPEQLRHAIDPRWRGELPRSYWFGADGKVAAHSGLISAATVAKYLAK